MGILDIFRKKKQSDDDDIQHNFHFAEYPLESQFKMACLGELAGIRNNASTEDLIGLMHTDLDEYVAWRYRNPRANPRDFFRRPGAMDIEKTKKEFEDLAKTAYEAYKYSKEHGREDEFNNLFKK